MNHIIWWFACFFSLFNFSQLSLARRIFSREVPKESFKSNSTFSSSSPISSFANQVHKAPSYSGQAGLLFFISKITRFILRKLILQSQAQEQRSCALLLVWFIWTKILQNRSKLNSTTTPSTNFSKHVIFFSLFTFLKESFSLLYY